MGRVSDVRGVPGEIVVSRVDVLLVWPDPGSPRSSPSPAGRIEGGKLGLIVSVAERGWTYVLWSSPMLLGWVRDGELRRLNQKG